MEAEEYQVIYPHGAGSVSTGDYSFACQLFSLGATGTKIVAYATDWENQETTSWVVNQK